jgi:uncharacterized protein
MAGTTTHADDLRAKLDQYRPEVENVLRRYGASNPRLFGSVARGDASPDSDIDLLVDLDPDRGNPLLRVSGMSERRWARRGSNPRPNDYESSALTS